jgi:glycosyltransferase involved in cell wall biosynthesis
LRLLRKERVKVLYIINQPMTQFWGTWCALLARVPVRVSTIGSTGKLSRVHRRLWINRLTFRFMSRVRALSQMHKAYLIEQEGIAAEKIEIIPNGVDLGRFSINGDPRELRASLGLVDSQPVVGIVAMLRPEKAHEVFLRAAARVLERVPETQFLVVGDGPERRRLEALAMTLGIDGRVRFLGARQDVAALVRTFDVGVLSSRPVVETLSNAVLEYMAAGKPVVATRVGSLPELIEEGQTGFFVEPGDWEALADRIVRLLQDRDLAERMGMAGRERVRRCYALEGMVHQHEALFERLLNHR